jgi:hypothetical protein
VDSRLQYSTTEVTLKNAQYNSHFFLTQAVEVEVQGVVGVEQGVPPEHRRRPHCLAEVVRAAVDHALLLELVKEWVVKSQPSFLINLANIPHTRQNHSTFQQKIT